MNRFDFPDLQGGQGQGDQRGNLIAHLQVDLTLQILADLLDRTDEHAAGAGDGVLHLAALVDDIQDHLLGLAQVLAAGLINLGKGGGVDVQGGDVTEDLVGVALHGIVDLLGGLGHKALGLNHAVDTILIAFFLHVLTSIYLFGDQSGLGIVGLEFLVWVLRIGIVGLVWVWNLGIWWTG